MEIFAPSAAQRRMLVELLANEFEGSLVVAGDAARETTLTQLVGLGWVAQTQGWFVLTPAGQDLAHLLADRMLGASRVEGYA